MLKDRKLLILPTPSLFDAPARWEPLRMSGWNLASENWNRGATRWWRNHDASFLLFWHKTGAWRTDGHVAVAKTRASIASCG